MQNAGLYIHIPFCEKKCGYCDFYSITAIESAEHFVEALLQEIDLISPRYSAFSFDTVFFGGGTPTVLSTSELERIWNRLQQRFSIDPDGEFSIEANPGTLDIHKLTALRHIGFNRLSLGVQSFHEKDLHFLGRIHSVEDVFRNFESIRKAGFRNINLDVMTAFPGLTQERFRHTLEQAVALEPEHLSCYTLIFEPKTPFYYRMKQGELQPPDDSTEAQFYEMTNQFLSDSGYANYEVSNFSRERRWRCRHNLKYWNHQPYLGLGPSAHSFLPPKRWWNVRPLHGYLTALKANKLPVQDEEILDAETLEFEYIFLHLRLREGIDTEDFRKRFRTNFIKKYKSAVESLLQAELIRLKGEQITLTPRGWLVADEIAGSF